MTQKTTPTSVLLFAAGLGTRMAPLTKMRPKPMIRVAGRPLLDHAHAHCDGLRVVVNTHYLAQHIHAHLVGTNAILSHEPDGALETGGGLKHALPMLDSNPVFTLNTDAVWRGANPLAALAKSWDPAKMEALLLMIPRHAAVGHSGTGDFDISPTGELSRGTDYVFSGAQIIRTDRLVHINDTMFSMWSLWTGMLERGTMFGMAYDGMWCDVGRPECIQIAETMLRGD